MRYTSFILEFESNFENATSDKLVSTLICRRYLYLHINYVYDESNPCFLIISWREVLEILFNNHYFIEWNQYGFHQFMGNLF